MPSDNIVTITRAKTGNIETYKDGKFVKETTSSGKSIARILIQPSASGGILKSKPVKTQAELQVSRDNQARQEQANVLTTALNLPPVRIVDDINQSTHRLVGFNVISSGRVISPLQFQREINLSKQKLSDFQRKRRIFKTQSLSLLDESIARAKALEVSGPTLAKLEDFLFKQSIRLNSAFKKLKGAMIEDFVIIKNSPEFILVKNFIISKNISSFPSDVQPVIKNLKTKFEIIDKSNLATQTKNNLKDLELLSFIKGRSTGLDKIRNLSVNEQIKILESKHKGFVKSIDDRIAIIKSRVNSPEFKSLGQEKLNAMVKQGELVSDNILKSATPTTKKLKALKEITPVFNVHSLSAYKKIAQGQKDKLTLDEKEALVFDLISAVPFGGFTIRAVKKGLKPTAASISLGAKALKLILKPSKILNLKNLLVAWKFVVSVAKDVGFTSRSINVAESFYNVDNNLLNQSAKKLGISNNKQLLNDYYAVILENDKGITPSDVLRFWGLTTASKKAIRKGMNDYSKILESRGFSKSQAKRVVTNLELKRKSRIFGELTGITRLELSSEALSQGLLRRGFRKRVSVGLGGAREGVSLLTQDFYVKGYNVTPLDFATAVFFGVTGSIFFSKQKLKDIKPSHLNRAINYISRKITNKLSKPKQEQILKKTISKFNKGVGEDFNKELKNNLKKLGKGKSFVIKKFNEQKKDVIVTRQQMEEILLNLNNVAKKRLINRFVKSSIKKSRVVNKGKSLRTKQLFMKRNVVANVIDPFEIVGDAIFDIVHGFKSRLLRRKIKTRVGRRRIRTFTKAKTQTKTKVKAKSKVASKTKSAVITKSKSKTKAQTKTKTKTKVKTKTRAQTKTKTKTKAKAQTKTKTKTKSIKFPIIRSRKKEKKVRTRKAYNIKIFKGNKSKILSVKLPINRAKNKAIDLFNAGKIDRAEFISSGVTKVKDVVNVKKKKMRRKK